MSVEAQVALATIRTCGAAGRAETARMTTEEIRESFLLQSLFVPGEMNLVYTDLDRLIVGGIMPQGEIPLSCFHELGTSFFTERREVGVLNIGDPGAIAVGSQILPMDHLDCLYIGLGERDVRFLPGKGGTTPSFYLCSSPAHRAFPTTRLAYADAIAAPLGDTRNAARRRIVKYVCPGGIESCQLVMGFTELNEGSVWNTMPAHTHSRRSEIYLYFDLEDEIVFHMLGEPGSTRHVIVRDREAVLSPWWSIHAGAGTRNYRFAWAMAGENQDFADVDPLPFSRLA